MQRENIMPTNTQPIKEANISIRLAEHLMPLNQLHSEVTQEHASNAPL